MEISRREVFEGAVSDRWSSARGLAQRVLREEPEELQRRLTRAFRLALGSLPRRDTLAHDAKQPRGALTGLHFAPNAKRVIYSRLHLNSGRNTNADPSFTTPPRWLGGEPGLLMDSGASLPSRGFAGPKCPICRVPISCRICNIKLACTNQQR